MKQTIPILILAFAASGCSMHRMIANKAASTLANTGTTFSSDPDPELVGQAVPFSLKLMESVLAETPRHKELLLATCRSFTQYSFAFLQLKADEIEGSDLDAAQALRRRARGSYLRAHDYCLRALEARHPGFRRKLLEDPKRAALSIRTAKEVPLLYWTAASWGAGIALSKDDPETVAGQVEVEALIDRAFELDPDFDSGAIHGFLVSYEGSRIAGTGPAGPRAREHFAAAIRLSQGNLASPFVALAESVSVQEQKQDEFRELLGKALAVNPDARPEWRLENLVMQHRARWLLGRARELFSE